MATVSSSFTSTSTGSKFYIRNKKQFTYSITGTFVATLFLERSHDNGISWDKIAQFTSTGTDQLEAVFPGGADGAYRFRCNAFTSGTATAVLADVEEQISAVYNSSGELLYELKEGGVSVQKCSDGLGSGSATGLSIAEHGNGAVHKTVFSLQNVPLEVVSVEDGNGVGGVRIYTFPEGYIHIHGCTANLTVGVETEADFTDGTPAGDLGVGTVAPANADALGTDATDDDIATATAFTMTDYVATAGLPSEASKNFDGTTTAIEVYVNALVDAADIDDDATTNLLISGTVTLVWSSLGDF